MNMRKREKKLNKRKRKFLVKSVVLVKMNHLVWLERKRCQQGRSVPTNLYTYVIKYAVLYI